MAAQPNRLKALEAPSDVQAQTHYGFHARTRQTQDGSGGSRWSDATRCAAARLEITDRRFRRIMEHYRLDGGAGLISKKRGRPSNNRLEYLKRLNTIPANRRVCARLAGLEKPTSAVPAKNSRICSKVASRESFM
jgi:hypothetical protein